MHRLTTLLDSNVIVAGLEEDHSHHGPSVRILIAAENQRFGVAAHSYAEAFTTLTRRSGPSPYGWEPARAWASLESVSAVTALVGLTPTQTVWAVRAFSEHGGIGARIYDWLIGQAAIEAGIPRVVTWNISHLRPLFPQLDILTPDQALT